MCGLAGVFAPQGGGVDHQAIEAVAELLDHRGPDYRGHHAEDDLGIVHTRLSLLDLSSAAHQPFADERYVLAYNGEIYNFEALRRELEAAGRSFATTSDTEVLFQLLASMPIDDVLPRLRGMFAFAFYDRVERRLTLARDRLGIKPLFYCEQSGRFAFASEWKALWALVEPELDETMALFSILGHADKARRRTPFRGVHQVEAGRFLIVDRDGIRERRYYDVRDDIDEATYRQLDGLSKHEVVERFAELFEQSVRSMLIADAPLGAFVSGGVDSGLIAATARSIRDIALFTSDVRGRHSEVEEARRTAAHLDAPLHRHGFEPDRFLDRWTRCTWHYEAPIVTHTNAVPFADVAALARETGVKAVLTGEGSDEMFLGYPRLLLERYAKPIRLPYRVLDAIYRRLPGFSRFVTSGPGLLSELEVQAQNYQRQRLRDDVLDRLHFVPARQRREQALTLLSLREGLAALLWRNDRMGMSASIEARFPFLDEAVVRFAINLPLRYKLRLGARFHDWKHPFVVDKWLVRELAARRLPSALAHQRKNGFPMYGHHHVVVDPGLFEDGFWPWLLGLDRAGVAHMIANADPYWNAKAASVEIWGRLFVSKQGQAEVHEHLRRHVTLRL